MKRYLIKTGTAIVLLAMVFFSSCRTTRETVQTATSIQTETQVTATKTEEVKTASQIVSATVEKVTDIDSSVVEQTIIEYSKPDSTGKQYVEKVTTTTTNAGKSRKAEKVESSNLNQDTEINTDETEIVKQEQTINAESKTKTIKKFAVRKLIPLIALLALVVFIVFKVIGISRIKGFFKR
jgi:predicted histidine transporter YuiF (NhaC family)